MVKIGPMLDPERIKDLSGEDKESALKEMVDIITTSPVITDRDEFEKAIFEREKVMSTGIGIGVAVPHVKIDCVNDFIIAVGRSVKGIDFNSLDGKPVHLIFMIGAATRQKDDFLKVLARVVHLIKNKGLQEKIMPAQSSEEIYELLKNY